MFSNRNKDNVVEGEVEHPNSEQQAEATGHSLVGGDLNEMVDKLAPVIETAVEVAGKVRPVHLGLASLTFGCAAAYMAYRNHKDKPGR